MLNGEAPEQLGRTTEFNDSATRVRSPQFRTLQNAVGGYTKRSLLDNLQPSRNALAGPDYERRRLGVTDSSLGQSTTTFNQGLWLRNQRPPERSAGINQ